MNKDFKLMYEAYANKTCLEYVNPDASETVRQSREERDRESARKRDYSGGSRYRSNYGPQGDYPSSRSAAYADDEDAESTHCKYAKDGCDCGECEGCQDNAMKGSHSEDAETKHSKDALYVLYKIWDKASALESAGAKGAGDILDLCADLEGIIEGQSKSSEDCEDCDADESMAKIEAKRKERKNIGSVRSEDEDTSATTAGYIKGH